MDLKALADYLGVHPHYARKLVREHRIKSTLVATSVRNVKRHDIAEADAKKYLSEHRSAGNGKIRVVMSPEEFELWKKQHTA